MLVHKGGKNKNWVGECRHVTPTKLQFQNIFMKHHAPNRCLNIKVAKIRTGLGSADMSHLQNCSFKIYLKSTGGGGGRGGGQDGCERRLKVFCDFFFFFFLGGGGGRVGLGGGGQGRFEQRSEVFVKIQKKRNFFRGGGGQVGEAGGHRVDVNKELKFL